MKIPIHLTYIRVSMTTYSKCLIAYLHGRRGSSVRKAGFACLSSNSPKHIYVLKPIFLTSLNLNLSHGLDSSSVQLRTLHKAAKPSRIVLAKCIIEDGNLSCVSSVCFIPQKDSDGDDHRPKSHTFYPTRVSSLQISEGKSLERFEAGVGYNYY
jgi:hypothetical protein